MRLPFFSDVVAMMCLFHPSPTAFLRMSAMMRYWLMVSLVAPLLVMTLNTVRLTSMTSRSASILSGSTLSSTKNFTPLLPAGRSLYLK